MFAFMKLGSQDFGKQAGYKVGTMGSYEAKKLGSKEARNSES